MPVRAFGGYDLERRHFEKLSASRSGSIAGQITNVIIYRRKPRLTKLCLLTRPHVTIKSFRRPVVLDSASLMTRLNVPSEAAFVGPAVRISAVAQLPRHLKRCEDCVRKRATA